MSQTAHSICYRLVGARDGVWPKEHVIQPGTIIRNSGDSLPDWAWNDETHDWVQALWEIVADPAAPSEAPHG